MEKIPAPEPLSENKLEVAVITPFDSIALAFSGGGFRAASFSLGVLSYLDKVKFDDPADELFGHSMLQRVSYMSSASGGTIATTLYALYNSKGKSFGDFYSKLLTALTGDELLKHAMEMLADKKYWKTRELKNRNIINAFALAYDKYLFDCANLHSLCHDGAPGKHLQEVCFNATEFFTGQSFRQDIKLVPDNGKDPYFTYGNMVIYLNETTAGKIKLGDILAASSCFPAGFEPIVFPDDFTYPGLYPTELKNALTMLPQTGDKTEKEFINKKHFGLMDGGITDNQGLQSMMYADGRRTRHETDLRPFDFLMVNDVGSHFITPYVMPEVKKGWELSIRGLMLIAAAVIALLSAGAWYGIRHNCAWLTVGCSLLITVPLIFLVLTLYLRQQLLGTANSALILNFKKNFTERIITVLVGYFAKTPLNIIKQMISARVSSVLMLNLSIFLKRIRQLLYNKFYFSPQWKNRGKGNHIYDLSFSNNINRKADNGYRSPTPPELDPSRDIQIVAQVAFDMGTTLWFDKQSTEQEHSEACIIACGQFTTCYNLLQYITRLLAIKPEDAPFDGKYRNRLLKLKQQMLADYEAFKTNPFFYYNQSGLDFKVPGFKAVTMKEIPFPDDWKMDDMKSTGVD